jgi:hypothetical protein
MYKSFLRAIIFSPTLIHMPGIFTLINIFVRDISQSLILLIQYYTLTPHLHKNTHEL